MTTTRAPATARIAAVPHRRTPGPLWSITACMWLAIAGTTAGLLQHDRFPVGPFTAADAVCGALAIAVGCWCIRAAARRVLDVLARTSPTSRHTTDAEAEALGLRKTPNWKD